MSNHINKLLILALGIAIGVIIMLLRERHEVIAVNASPNAVRSPGASVLPTPAPRSNQTPSPLGQPAEIGETPETLEDDTASFEAEMQRVLRGDASEEEQLAFWQGIQTSKRLDALIADLQGSTQANPGDIASRLSLAQAYVAKLWGSPAGPAQGLWAAKAESMWKEVLAADPENWEAQRNIGFSYSQYPDFLNKTGAAIAEYEKTLALQEAAPEPRARFAKTYLELAKLHVKNGDPSSALATLEKGASAHPDDAALAEQLRVISSSYKFEDVSGE